MTEANRVTKLITEFGSLNEVTAFWLTSHASESENQVLSDYKLVAALLFQRWNDGTIRYLTYVLSSAYGRLTIVAQQEAVCFRVEIPAIEQLDQLGYLYRDHRDMTKFLLSENGKREGVFNWFKAELLDRLTLVPRR